MHLVSVAREAYMGRCISAVTRDLQAHGGDDDEPPRACLYSAALLLSADRLSGQDLAAALGFCVAAEALSQHEAMLEAVGPLTEWLEFETVETITAGRQAGGLPN